MLNAFRHHRNSHRRLGQSRLRNLHVLNAFRHHRNSHQFVNVGNTSAIKCSTPFGIIGIHTERLAGRTAFYSAVLNAFRHHRNSHRDKRRASSDSISAQRLSASSEFTHEALAASRAPSAECSTPFGIIGIHTVANRSITFFFACAQRLSASSEFTHGTQIHKGR